jgi:putative heme-binding domain-containing protein
MAASVGKFRFKRIQTWIGPFFAAALSAVTAPVAAQEPHVSPLGFAVPPGFEVSLYADDSLATDIHCLTIDAEGRVVVAGKGYVKVLHDADGDGKADKATVYSDVPKSGAHGMVFDGDDLVCVGDAGVHRLVRGKLAGPPWIVTKMAGDHVANGLVRGPDGWYYLACGNDALDAVAAAAGSPVRRPHMGAVVRFSPDGKTTEVVADGFRNPYDLAFNGRGDLFTVDADGERIHHLPYYTPTRLFDVAQGAHHGWVMPGWVRSWARPAHWPDNVDRLVEIGRGSPTGVVVYRHRAFPAEYRDGVFSLCWTFGRVYFFPMSPKGSTSAARMEVFMKSTGDSGFAPTDMAVGPDGDLFIAIGGRGTRGGVFRVRYVGDEPAAKLSTDPLRAVLQADEPLSSWSRARWIPAARRLGSEAIAAAVVNRELPAAERMRAIEILTEVFGGLAVKTATQLSEATDPADVVARAAWALSRGAPSAEGDRLLARWTASGDPRIARAVWEALAASSAAWPADVRWSQGFGHADRCVRAAAIRAAQGRGKESYLAREPVAQPTRREVLADFWIRNAAQKPTESFVKECLECCASPDGQIRLEGVRLLQLALGDVHTADGPDRLAVGYAAAAPDRLPANLKRQILSASKRLTSPSRGHAEFDRELARLVGMIGEPALEFLPHLAAQWTDRSAAEDDIHYLLVLARIGGPRPAEVTRRTADAVNGILPKLAARGAQPSDQAPAILEAVCDRLIQLDPALPAAMVSAKSFAVKGQELFGNRLPIEQKQQAARILTARLRDLNKDEAAAAWSPELVRLVAALPPGEVLPLLRPLSADPSLADPIALVLAGQRHPDDRPRFVAALGSTQPRVVAAAADALASLPEPKVDVKELAAAVRALRRLSELKDEAPHKSVAALLAHWTGRPAVPAGAKEPAAVAAGWFEWFTKTYPKDAPALLGMTGADAPKWLRRLGTIDWSAGDVQRGLAYFQAKACVRCHGEARRLGPDLAGIAQRFSRDDLFLHIVDPNKDISPAFVPTAIVTTSGKTYTGMLIYKSQELTLLQTSPDTTVRIPGAEVESVRPSRVSFMPTGLLDDAADRDLADLYAYLKSLRK